MKPSPWPPKGPRLIRWRTPAEEQHRSRYPEMLAYICVQMLEKHPENCHFRHFGDLRRACRRRAWLGNTLQNHEIGHEACWAGHARTEWV